MAKRVAITIAGAVSLGSYEAGVTYELLEALRLHNEACDAAKTPDAKIYVDVITGASAGGMTAAMLAQRLMFDGAVMQGEFTNPLYHAWVERISLEGLVKLHKAEKRWNSLFSSDLIDEIGAEMLVRWLLPKKHPKTKPEGEIETAGAGTLSGPHAVVEATAPTPLRLGMALTNLNGIDYMLPIVGNDEDGFHYTGSVDQVTENLELTSKDDAELWVRVHGAAVGSGAFPVAFRPKAIKRDVTEYGTRVPKPLPDPPTGKSYVDWGSRKDSMQFAYSDGGILQNQPLGMAKNLIDERVEQYLSLGRLEEADTMASDRLYVFISPNDVRGSNDKLVAGEITIWKELVELLHTYMRQAMFHDWIVAEGMNAKVRLLDQRAENLAQALITGRVDAKLLSPASDQLNELLLQNKGRTLARLRLQYAKLYNTVLASTQAASGTAVADAFLNGIATLEAAAELGTRDTMKIVAVIAKGRVELAGSGISAFVGFFDRAYREHDYWVGRVKARAYLQRADVKRILSVAAWPNEANWGGTTEDEIARVLKNPTDITAADLPLKPSTFLKPARRYLLHLVRIRPALWIIPVLLLLTLLALVAAVVFLIVIAFSSGAIGMWLGQHH